jgi:hypothetical protein
MLSPLDAISPCTDAQPFVALVTPLRQIECTCVDAWAHGLQLHTLDKSGVCEADPQNRPKLRPCRFRAHSLRGRLESFSCSPPFHSRLYCRRFWAFSPRPTRSGQLGVASASSSSFWIFLRHPRDVLPQRPQCVQNDIVSLCCTGRSRRGLGFMRNQSWFKDLGLRHHDLE